MQPSAIMTGALRLKPNLAVAYINRAIVHRDKGEYDAALRDYDMALRLESYASLYLNRGFLSDLLPGASPTRRPISLTGCESPQSLPITCSGSIYPGRGLDRTIGTSSLATRQRSCQ